ncbi:Hypothetical predicted protein [Mytilus galloprovincialis]|uniref:ZMYM2-like/QRICH1 C-terminal domain-containing protein n=1 Tax=Mytilus galloprovincialis TaxID=29158 RepID=A0A8B6C8J9_MYTGA|nr:Hypothetical predicted protein [Mytilus galloprovincialis]
MASEINNDPHIGARVKLVGGIKGIILRKTINFDFPLWEIKLDSGKVVTEARYRFDIIEDGVQNIEPEIIVTKTNTKQKMSSLAPAKDPCHTDEFSDSDFMYLAEPIHESNKDLTLPKLSSKTKKRQFVTIPEDCIDTFVLDQENKNTARKTQSDIQSLQQFLITKLETREIYSIPPHELNQILCQFLISVRKDDGNQYEPASLKGMLCSFDRYLRHHNYGYQISKSAEFSKVKDVLTAKQVELKKLGKGNGHKKAETLCDEDIEKLFQSGEIGDDNPTTLLHTVWFFNTIYFGLRGVTEHHQMTWGDVKIVRDTSSGLEYLQMNERNTKTRTGKSLRDQRDIPQMAWANLENKLKCPVHAYKLYKSKRPLKYSNPSDPFYIQENINREKNWPLVQEPTHRHQQIRKIYEKDGNCCSKEDDDNDESENDSGNRRLTNHSARRFMLQKLDDAGFEHNHIKQISGHKNIQSISTYSKLNSKKHQEISRTILADKSENMQSSQTTRTVTINNNPVGQNVQKTAVSENQVSFGNLASAPTATGLSCLFGGPIYGGTFNINMSNLPSLSPSPQITKRRRYVIESDSSQE